MKRFDLIFVLAFIVSVPAVSASYGLSRAASVPRDEHGKKHEFAVRQYDEFHEVLHPLQHEALPGKDFQRIRTQSALLANRGKAIVRLGIPRSVSAANKQEFATELNKFRQGIARFRADARKGTDAELEASFSAIHDSFEMLAAMLPRG